MRTQFKLKLLFCSTLASLLATATAQAGVGCWARNGDPGTQVSCGMHSNSISDCMTLGNLCQFGYQDDSAPAPAPVYGNPAPEAVTEPAPAQPVPAATTLEQTLTPEVAALERQVKQEGAQGKLKEPCLTKAKNMAYELEGDDSQMYNIQFVLENNNNNVAADPSTFRSLMNFNSQLAASRSQGITQLKAYLSKNSCQ